MSTMTQWLHDRKLDPKTIVQRFSLKPASKWRRPAIRFPTGSVDRIRFVDGKEPKSTWSANGGTSHWYGWKFVDFFDSNDVWIVEGEPSVWAMHQSGIFAVTCFSATSIPAKKHLNQLASLKRRVNILYDHDDAGKEGAARLGQALFSSGCEVVIREWSKELFQHLDIKPKKGFDPDDLHQVVGDERLSDMIYNLPCHEVEREDLPLPFRKSHQHLAEITLARIRDLDGPQIVYTNDQYWKYNGGAWSEVDSKLIERHVSEYDGLSIGIGDRETTIQVGASLTRSVEYQCRVTAYEPDFFGDAQHGIQFRNGFFDIAKMELIESSPSLKQQHIFPCDYDEDATCYNFEATLSQWAPNELDRKMVQEFAGAILFGIATTYDRLLMVTGPGGNGKSQILDMLSGLVPESAKSNYEPNAFVDQSSSEYYRARLQGKLLNVFADLPANDIINSSFLKMAVAGDEVSGRHPSGKPFDFRPRAAHLYSCNELPASCDHTHGFWRRILLLNVDFKPKEEDKILNLGQKLLDDERAGIMLWAIEGAKRLVENGGYTISEGMKKSIDAWQKDSDQVALFIDQTCRRTNGETDDDWIDSDDLFREYKDWARIHNHGAMSSTKFGRRMSNLGYTKTEGRKRRHRQKTQFAVNLLAHTIH